MTSNIEQTYVSVKNRLMDAAKAQQKNGTGVLKQYQKKEIQEVQSEKEDKKNLIIDNTRFDIKNQAQALALIERQALQIENDGKKEFYTLRVRWSGYIFLTLLSMIIFQFVLFICLIIGTILKLDFSGVSGLLYLISGQNFAQILGLSYIIVRFLFSREDENDDSDEKNNRKTQKKSVL